MKMPMKQKSMKGGKLPVTAKADTMVGGKDTKKVGTGKNTPTHAVPKRGGLNVPEGGDFSS